MTTHEPRPPLAPRSFAPRLALAAVPAALVWLGLNGTDRASWIVGGPVVAAAARLGAAMVPGASWPWSARGALAFGGHFFRESIRGGWDVARRALSPSLPLAPSVVGYETRLPAGAPRWLFCTAVSLLPGTAVIEIGASRILVHVLHSSQDAPQDLRQLEARVAALFGLRLPEPPGGAA